MTSSAVSRYGSSNPSAPHLVDPPRTDFAAGSAIADRMRSDPQVDAWLTALDHPQKDVIQAVRGRILAVDPLIEEGIKWNAGSFRTREWFATFNVRGPRGPKPVTLVLHLGAKVRSGDLGIPDPAGLLHFLGKDRATITFTDVDDVARKAAALDALVRAWIAAL